MYSSTSMLKYVNVLNRFTKSKYRNLIAIRNYGFNEEVRDELKDILEQLPPTYFDYPKKKIHIPQDSKTVFEIWRKEIDHYIDYFKNPEEGKSLWRQTLPEQFDIMIIGGGYIGSSIAYWLREKHRHAQSIIVIDKDLSLPSNSNYGCETPEQIPAALSIGNFRQQFSLKQNIQSAQFSAKFFRDINTFLSIPEEPDIHLPYRPFGYLTLADEKSAEKLKKNHFLQCSLQVNNELLTSFQMNQRFPWLNTTDLTFGCHGLENEGWIDTERLLLAMRSRAMRYGAVFLEAEPLEFVYPDEPWVHFQGFGTQQYKPTNHLTVRLRDGTLKTIIFGQCILALGHETGTFAKEFLNLNQENPGLFSLEIPIKRRKRYVFCFEAPDGGPELSSPMIIDPCGLFVKRVGINDYICGMAPIPAEEPSADNLDVDYDFFYKRIWPFLAHRIPIFEQLRLKAGWACYYDHNTFDGNGILGRVPAYHNLFLAAGFGELGVTQSPAIGIAMRELLFEGYYSTVDFNKLSYKRILYDYTLNEGMRLA